MHLVDAIRTVTPDTPAPQKEPDGASASWTASGSEAVSIVRRNRHDETWHRLRDWTGGQAKSEMLAWQVVDADGYTRVDPTHTHGGPDGGGDAKCERDGEICVMAAYFPLGQDAATIKRKLEKDMNGAKQRGATGIVFVTDQEITLADREAWEKLDQSSTSTSSTC